MLTSFCHQVLIEKGTRGASEEQNLPSGDPDITGIYTAGTRVKQMLDFKKKEDTNMVFLLFLSVWDSTLSIWSLTVAQLSIH